MLRFYYLAFAVMVFPGASYAADYKIDYASSQIQFSGKHAGNDFAGVFEEWHGEITFDPDDLESSFITAVFNTASARTGNKMYDGTLPQADWFDVKNHPDASYKSTSIAAPDALDGGRYQASGDLSIRGVTQPVIFDFRISDVNADPVIAEGSISIDRLMYDIGRKSDAAAEWVSREITIDFKIVANRVAE